MISKLCSICKIEKTISEFNFKQKNKDKRQTHCKECNRLRSKLYYNSNKEKHSKETQKRKKKQIIILQQYTYDLLKKSGCSLCLENDPCCLDFDHQRDKRNLVSKMVARGVSLTTLKEEIDKCIILCANCHRKKTAKDFNWYKNINTGSSPNGMAPDF